MTSRLLAPALFAAMTGATNIVLAQTLRNFGDDPFLQVSQAISDCPEPAGPRISEDEWKRDAHHRIEEGNHCYVEGRCRLANAYRYDKDIAEAVQRRLDTLRRTLPGWQNSSLWIMVRGRWLTVQGCVAPGFDRAPFLAALKEVADVERVIDQTTATPARGVPYTRYALPATNAPSR
ncbi:BON domain-containing protein [Cupriavidus sp. YR651]|uniref:BON domain-containing protein n=1 Tax=Cupriavidus sp. YR651 TaxID=1855315 RepID=UPI00350F5058